MNDRFKFNAIVSSYYDIDTPENYEEFEPQFYLKNVDVFCTGEIGIDYDVLFEVIKEQSKNLTEKETGQIMKHFEDNSNSPECDYVTIRPDKILQCTGLKDKNGKLIYEGDVIKFKNTDNKYYVGTIKYTDDDALFCLSYKNENNRDDWDYVSKYRLEVIGNIYEDKDLLNENS